MKPIRILHVEDSEGDILLIHDAIEETGLAYHIDVAGNGEEALRFLLQKKDQFYEGVRLISSFLT
jgi:CheY-like chemotaxis protein